MTFYYSTRNGLIVNQNDLKPEWKWLGTATETIFNRNFIAPKMKWNEIQPERFETGFLRTENGTKRNTSLS